MQVSEQLGRIIMRWALLCALLGGALMFANVAQEIALWQQLLSEKTWLLDVDAEVAFYTWLSASSLFVNSLVLFVIAENRRINLRNDKAAWYTLAGGFAFLSIDEFSSIHELLSRYISANYAPSGAFYYAWVIPALLGIAIAIFYFYPMLRNLKSNVALAMVAAGALYVGGAVGMEMLSAGLMAGNQDTIHYRLLAATEETLELAGTLLFTWVLGRWLQYFISDVSDRPAATPVISSGLIVGVDR